MIKGREGRFEGGVYRALKAEDVGKRDGRVYG